MMYFIYQLTHDKWNTPWTFIWVRMDLEKKKPQRAALEKSDRAGRP